MIENGANFLAVSHADAFFAELADLFDCIGHGY